MLRISNEKQKRFSSKLHRASAVGALCIAVILATYALPTLLEGLTIPYLGIWVSCSLIGDVAGSIGLYLLGLKREAIFVYLLSKVTEVSLLAAHILSAKALFWVTDLFPAIVCMDILVSKIFYASEKPYSRP